MKAIRNFIAAFAAAMAIGAWLSPAHAANPLGNAVASQQTPTATGSLILKATGGYLQGFSATSGATPGYVLIFDSATVPSDGTVTPKFCYYLPATETTGAQWVPYSVPFVNGVVLVFSSTGCFSKTISATAFLSGQVQ